MPAVATKTRFRRKGRPRRAKLLKHRKPRDPSVVTRNGRTTHVILPIDEYERLLRHSEVPELIAIAEDKNPDHWVSLEDFSIQLAVDRIVEARKRAGLTQAQLAAKLKMPQSQISRIERNPDRTTVRTLKKIAKALGVDVSKII